MPSIVPKICPYCDKFLKELADFSKVCARTQTLMMDIMDRKLEEEYDLQTVREGFGLGARGPPPETLTTSMDLELVQMMGDHRSENEYSDDVEDRTDNIIGESDDGDDDKDHAVQFMSDESERLEKPESFNDMRISPAPIDADEESVRGEEMQNEIDERNQEADAMSEKEDVFK